MNLREEIKETLLQVYPFGIEMIHHTGEDEEYAEEATKDIISKFEKGIDELKKKYPKDLYGAYNAGLDDIKEMLK